MSLPADGVGPQTAQQFSAVPPENVTGNYTKVIQRVPVKIAIDPATNTLRGLIRPGLSVLARVDTMAPSSGAPGVRTER